MLLFDVQRPPWQIDSRTETGCQLCRRVVFMADEVEFWLQLVY